MKYLPALMLATCLSACLNKEDAVTSQSNTAQPGQLQLAPLSSAKTNAHTIPLKGLDSTAIEFDLGVANSSTQRFFILKNLGDKDIHNITLTTDNPNFYFNPSVIRDLPPSKNSSVLQVITLNVIHGNRLDGLGPDSLLLKGVNTANAHLSGITFNGSGDSLVVAQDVGFQIFANLLDFRIYKSDGTDEVLSKYKLDTTTLEAFTSTPVRSWNTHGDTVKIENTGNVPFSVRVWHLDSNESPVLFDAFDVDTGRSFRLAPAYIEIDGHGVITDPSKLYLQPAQNDKIYMGL